jgi:hypothetical protein
MKVNIGDYPDNDEERVVEVHIDDFDVWSFDHTLALIILPALKMLKVVKNGAPFVDNEDVPEHLRSEVKDDDGTEVNFFNRWDYVLDEMIWAFQEIVVDTTDQFHTGERDTWSQPVDKDCNPIGEPIKLFDNTPHKEDPRVKYYQMVKGPNDTSKFDSEGYTAHNKRIKTGTTLFGKYYAGLWD